MPVSTISPERFREMVDADEELTVIDTRDEESFESWHVEGAERYRHTPDHEFDLANFQRVTSLAEEDAIVTMCAKGVSSTNLAEKLADAGYRSVSVVEGGMEGWSRVYDHVEVPTMDPSIEIVQVQRRAKGCLGYLVGSDTTGEAAVIDATRHGEEFLDAAEKADYDITHVFDTHIHADHVSGGRKLADEVGAIYYLGATAAERNVEYDYDPLAPNEVVEVGDVDVKAIHAPGHTSEMTCYLVGREAIATGDTLFTDSVGRTELQFGDRDAATGAHMLYETLHRTLLAEPDDVTVLPGHVSVTNDGRYEGGTPGEPITATIGTARTEIALLRANEELFVSELTDTLPEKPPNYESVVAINTGREQPDSEQEVVELELGPNRCAAD